VDSDLPLFCYEGDGTTSLKAIFESYTSPATISLVVGAEGGFSLHEAEAAKKAGFHMVNLGARILRCETAPLYALSALSYFYEL
jgi:16S rRNA (uracil1498-N3)-methyltransferase